MYTAKIQNKIINELTRQLEITVQFTNGTNTVTKTIDVPLGTDVETIKLAIKKYALDLENAETNIQAIPNGDIDLSAVTINPPQVEKTAGFLAWNKEYERLKIVQSLIDMGVLTGNETKVVALRDKVKTDLKPTYIDEL